MGRYPVNEQVTLYSPHGQRVVPALANLKLHVSDPHRMYTSGDMIRGRIELDMPSDLSAKLKAKSWTCNVVVQLKCILELDLGQNDRAETVEYERRITMRGPNAYLNVITPGKRVIPFLIQLDDAIGHHPPTFSFKDGGYADGGTKWVIAAWIEGKSSNGFVEVNNSIKDQQIVKVYPLSPPELDEDISADDVFSDQEGRSGCKIAFFKLPSYLPQSPEHFDLKFRVTSDRSVYIHQINLELEMELTLFAGKRTKVHRKLEKIGSITYNSQVTGKTALVATGCIIPTRRVSNFCTPNVQLTHNLLVTLCGPETASFRVPADVSLPKPIALDTFAQTQGRESSWCGVQ